MSTDAVTPLRHRMIEDMNARKLCAGTQRGNIHSCKRFAVFLNRFPVGEAGPPSFRSCERGLDGFLTVNGYH